MSKAFVAAGAVEGALHRLNNTSPFASTSTLIAAATAAARAGHIAPAEGSHAVAVRLEACADNINAEDSR